MRKYDVIIIGAGPGGLRCAEILGKNNKKVLLLEKNSEIGPKICAGGLTRKAFKYLHIPDRLVEKRFQNIVFQSPKQRTKLEFGEDFAYTIEREKLGQWQLNKLQSLKSVDVETSVEVVKIGDEYIVTGYNEKIYFEKLVGADGSNSVLRKHLKISSRLIGIAFHYLIPIKQCRNLSEIEVHFDSKLFSAWYSWIFPHREYVSVGYGCFPKVKQFSTARKNFLQWIKKTNIDTHGCQFQSFPINCDYKGFIFQNKYYLVGDAAGLASGFTGEGIFQAFTSGEEVAKKILDKNYRCKKIKEMLNERKIQHLMLVIVLLSGIFRNMIFEIVVFSVKSKFIARTLLRILT
ncbi:MAG: NAD(P)/FAD-dependent oxidoreductase [Patescibacteria group bacterium]|nr:NAD(P)/FAD-dependent oxidoreductase [Patescibacteria group bacterium]